MLKVGLLGAGRIGQVHALNIERHPQSQLAAISDVHRPAAEALAKKHNTIVKGADAIIADPEIDAVLVATSTDTHSDFTEAAAKAGKAVFCEKPIDLSLERAIKCQTLVRETGMPVMLGFNRRFDPSFGALKTALDAGEIGKSEMLSITSFDPAPPPVDYVKVSGGLFRDMMIHDFDMANFLMNALPKTVSAAGSSIVDPKIGAAGDVDTAVVTLSYEDGRIAVIRNSRRAAYGYDQRIEMLGSKGLLQAENKRENTVVKSTGEGVTGAKPLYFFLERYLPAFEIQWAAFVDAVTNMTSPPTSLDDGIASLAMAEAATLSLKTGGPVELRSVYP